MRIITALLSLFTRVHASELPANYSGEVLDGTVGNLVNRLANELMRTPSLNTGLDDTTLGKTGSLAVPQRTVLKSLLPPRTSSHSAFHDPLPSSGGRIFAYPSGRHPYLASSCRPMFRSEAAASSSLEVPVSDAPRTVKLINDLQSADFQHPMDKQASNARQLFAPLEWGIRQAISAFVEDAVFMDNIASGVLVGPNQLPELHNMLLESCRILGLSPVPDLYIRQSPSPNAYTLAVQGRRPFVVVTTALLDLMNPIETQAVIAHELGHLKCEHSIGIALANLILSPLASVLPVGNAALETSLLQWQRAAELTCDRAALMVVQDVRAVQSVIMKLCGGGRTYAQRMDVDAFVKQANAYDEVSQSRAGRLMRQSQVSQATHPLPILRARELERFAESKQYKALLDRGKPTQMKYRPSLASNGTYVR